MEREKFLYRKKHLVYPRFQLSLIGAQAAILLVSYGLITFNINQGYRHLNELGNKANITAAHPYFKFLGYQQETLLQYVMWAFIAAFVLSMVVTLLISHKLAGPIVRLRKELKYIAEQGQFRPFEFRKKDYIHDIGPLLNDAFSSVEERLAEENKKESA